MKKKPRPSIDGFIPRQSGYVVGSKHRTLGEPNRELGHGGRPIDSEGGLGEDRDLQSDLHVSLEAIDQEQPADKKGKKLSRRQKRRDKKQKRAPSKKRKIFKISLIVLAVLVAGFIGYFAWKFIQAGGRVLNGNLLDIFQHQKLAEDANGRTNILIFGTSGWTMDQNNGWDGGLLTDSIMVLSVNQTTYDAYTISLPRDLYVEHTCTSLMNTSAGRLNETYICGYSDAGNNMDAGAKALMKTAGKITGLDIQYFVHANWTAFEKGINAVGGVDVTIESDDPRGVYDVATGINYKNGQTVHMNGKTALAFARARGSAGGYGLSGSNFAREINQQRILNALLTKVTSTGTLLNPAAVSGLIDALGSNLRTNFQTGEARALIDIAKNTQKAKSLPFVDRPNDEPNLVTTGNISGQSVVLPVAGLFNYSDIQTYILKNLVGEDYVFIDVLNGSGETGLAQTKANELKQQGYGIGAIANSPVEVDESVRLYKISKGLEKATETLETKYGVMAQSVSLPGYTPSGDADFVIVFGKG